jgi:hypothetical protein
MVNVRVMWMRMDQRVVPMRMTVRCWISHGRITRPVLVLMMRVVQMRVFVLHRFVDMLMLVPFREMEPDAGRHAAGAHQQQRRHALSPSNDGNHCTDERSE